MTRIEKFFFSTKTMTVLLLIYAFSMAIATFVESETDTPTAKSLIYDAKWFELLMLWLILIFVANIKKYNLLKREKWPILMFHLAFIVMFIGGAVTRYASFEGQMPIKEGETTNEIISDKTYFKLDIGDSERALRYDQNPYRMSYFNAANTMWPFKRTFKQSYQFGDKVVTLKTLDYIPMAKDSVRRNESGKKMLEIVTMGQNGRENNYITEGEIKDIGGTMMSFNNPIEGSVQLFEHQGNLWINSPFEGNYMSMAGQEKGVVTDSALLASQSGTIGVNQPQQLNFRTLYTIHNSNFIIPAGTFQGEVVYYRGDKTNPMDKNLSNKILVELSSGNEKDTLLITGGKSITGYSKNVKINGLNVSIGFGSKVITTPFSIRCDDFIMDKYPGSNNPSSYESEITVIVKGVETPHHIYMNNVLDYRGYRFFQASYFPDESGTILSVNADWWGTNITYLGYFFLFTGMFVTLFWKGTHFSKLNEKLKKMHRKTALLIPFMLMVGFGNAQDSIQPEHQNQQTEMTENPHKDMNPAAQFAKPGELGEHPVVDPVHADKFGHIMVQDFQGRIKPMNTHVLELLRKIYKKDKYHTADGQTISAEQWFLSMQIDPGEWVSEPIIKVGAKGGDALMQQTKADKNGYTTYANLMDIETGRYILEDQYNEAFSKRQAEQSNYDKEVISVTERFNIFNNIVLGYYTKIIPVKNDLAETWTSWIYSSEESPVEINRTAFDYITAYFDAVKQGIKTGDWKNADEKLDAITAYQHEWGKNVVPSKAKIDLEVKYNRANLFLYLMIAYSMLGILLVVLAFFEVLTDSKKTFGKIIHILTKTLIGLMIAVLFVHLVGLGVRWYLSGHALWSSGYEAIVFISAVGVFSGLLLYKNRNAFIPAAGALVAMIMMGFAHGGSMLDPQITPLEPVLKSYWLMVHVGIITSSYGFFGLSAVIAVISLIMISLKPTAKIKHSIKELTIVNEMAAEIGIFALTVGTFLGGMWANESWGRYWSWDPKETWAFISVLFYAVVLHFRIVPGLRGRLAFNIASMWAIWSVIFTYFGVNYYLVGLHSYAAGDPIPVPSWIYITAAAMTLLTLVAYFRDKKFNPKTKKFVKETEKA